MTHRRGGIIARPRSLDELISHTSPAHVEGARVASEAFRRSGVPHVLVGGLAVGMCGYPRQTKDVDFLVGDEAFDFHGLVVSPKPGLPLRYSGITIDWVSLETRDQAVFGEYLVLPEPGEVPIMDASPLAAMKLVAGRQRDRSDVVELIKAGLDLDELRTFVRGRLPQHADLLEKLIEDALREE